MRCSSTASIVIRQPSPSRARPETASRRLPVSAASCSRARRTSSTASSEDTPSRCPFRPPPRSSPPSPSSLRSSRRSSLAMGDLLVLPARGPPVQQLQEGLLLRRELDLVDLAQVVRELRLRHAPADLLRIAQLELGGLGDPLGQPHHAADRRERQQHQLLHEAHRRTRFRDGCSSASTKEYGGIGPLTRASSRPSDSSDWTARSN